jgi:hypothetical protein
MGNASEAIGWIAWHLQHEETGGNPGVALEDSPSRFIPGMLTDGAVRARRTLALYGEQPRIDIADLTFTEDQVLGDWLPDDPA